MKKTFSSFFFLGLVLTLALGAGCAPQNESLKPDDTIGPPLSQAETDKLEPGLTPYYIFKKYRNIDRMPSDERIMAEGVTKKPILKIDHQFGGGNVFDSRRNQGVGMLILGFIKFDKPGEYRFQVLSNDGVRIFLGNRVIINDPTVHSDQFAESLGVVIEQEGWIPLRIKYFQRKGTAALSFRWKTPDMDSYAPVPPEALAHLPLLDS